MMVRQPQPRKAIHMAQQHYFSLADNSQEPRPPACSMANGRRTDGYLAGNHGCTHAAETKWWMERLPHGVHMDVMTLKCLWTNQPVIMDLMCLLDHLVFQIFWSLHFVQVDTDLCVLDHLAEVSHTSK